MQASLESEKGELERIRKENLVELERQGWLKGLKETSRKTITTKRKRTNNETKSSS